MRQYNYSSIIGELVGCTPQCTGFATVHSRVVFADIGSALCGNDARLPAMEPVYEVAAFRDALGQRQGFGVVQRQFIDTHGNGAFGKGR